MYRQRYVYTRVYLSDKSRINNDKLTLYTILSNLLA